MRCNIMSIHMMNMWINKLNKGTAIALPMHSEGTHFFFAYFIEYFMI